MQKDLRSYLGVLRQERPQDFVRVSKPVSADREPAALLRRLEAEGHSPLLYFEQIEGSAMPLVVNCHGTRGRLALALGVPTEQLHSTYRQRLEQPIDPIAVKDGPVREVIIRGENIDLNIFPLVTPSDNCRAPYIGGGILVARDPVSGTYNLSYHRLMLQGPRRFGFHAAPGLHLSTILRNADARDEELEVAIIIGCHPAFGIGTLAKVPFAVDEYTCAGAMLQEPVPLLRGETVDLEVPANAETILEGRVLRGVQELEGPYDEFTGYAMPAAMQPVIEITAITHRRQPIYQDVFGGSREHLLMGSVPKEATLLGKLQGLHPAVRDVFYAQSGGGRLHAVISIGPHHPVEVRRLMLSTFSLDHFLKHVFVVDDDIDICSDEQVLWALATRFQGDTDMLMLERMLGSSLDPSAQNGGIATKVGFDCTRKKSDFPPPNRIAQELLAKMSPADYIEPQ